MHHDLPVVAGRATLLCRAQGLIGLLRHGAAGSKRRTLVPGRLTVSTRVVTTTVVRRGPIAIRLSQCRRACYGFSKRRLLRQPRTGKEQAYHHSGRGPLLRHSSEPESATPSSA